jgi:hypothetical protein
MLSPLLSRRSSTAALITFDARADVMGERRRIITNDWLAAYTQSLETDDLSYEEAGADSCDTRPIGGRSGVRGGCRAVAGTGRAR